MRSKFYTFYLFVILFGMFFVLSLSYAQDDADEAEMIAAGKEVYEKSCAHCHGNEGRGDGSAAENLLPQPRDFTRGLYKIRSTESGELPTDQDLFDIITEGMPGTSMPEWETALDADERWQVVAYIKTFYEGFKESETTPKEIRLAGKIPYSEESIEIGKELYTQFACYECHGDEGRGDGTSAPTLTDEWDYKSWPANLHQNWNYRGGNDIDDIYKRFIGGIAGSAMPMFDDPAFGLSIEEARRYNQLDNMGEMTDAEEEEYTGLADKMENAFEILDIMNADEGDEEQRKFYEESMKAFYEKSWHLANYVKSLSPEKRPEAAIGKNSLRSQYVEGELPSMDDAVWDALEASYFPLVGQIIIEPRQFNPTIDSVNVKSYYNDTHVAFLFIWDDRTHNTAEEENEDTGKTYEDGIAIQFPVKIPKGPTSPKPYFLWGGKLPVYLWHWQASAPEKTTELTAKGINNATVQDVQTEIQTESTYSKGQYKLWIKRSLKTEDKKDLQLEPGVFAPIAFSVWDGANGDVGTKRVISSWYSFVLEPIPSSKRFIYPPIVALLSLGLLIGLRGFVQRRNTELNNTNDENNRDK